MRTAIYSMSIDAGTIATPMFSNSRSMVLLACSVEG